MLPIYGRTMDSYPHQRNQSDYQQTFPSHYIPLNPLNPPMLYQPWPHSGNYSYPYPVPFNSSCNHGNFPGFHNNIPLCPQPQPFHYCPSQPYSACYFPPPPHYTTGTSNNNMAWNQDRHCFGRPFHESEDRGVRVEEPVKPARNGSLVPVHPNGYPFPVVWVPQEYVKPPDGDSLKYLMGGGDETRVQDQKVAKERNEDPIPFIWMPYGGIEKEAKMKEDVEKSENQLQFPLVWMPGRDTRVKAVEYKDEKEASASPKGIGDLPLLLKFVPVEKLGGDKGLGNSTTKEENSAEAKKEERAVTRKDVPVKPELPPVCLRVDPLPKKKTNGNVKPMSTDNTLSNNEEPKESVVVTEKVSDRPQVEREEVGKKPLSDAEAALRIQSAYRGYEVRRSQSLKKLKQISEVREQVADVRNRIRALESSSDVRKDDKQRLVMGEIIMRLLLQLDTIQGLLPSLRDVRKTLAKELVSLQEKLDSLVIEPEKPELETCASVPVDVLSVEAECNHEKPEETLVIEPGKPKSDFGSSGPMDELGSEAECKQEKPEETLVIEPEKPKSETFSSEPVDVPSVEAEEVECMQETPEEIHVIESEKPESETCASGLVNVLGVGAKEVECKQEKPDETHVIESEEPRSETCDSGPVDVLGVKAEEVESGQEKPEEIHVIKSEKPKLETFHSGPVDVLGAQDEEAESGQEKTEEKIERDRSCDDVPERSFDVIESRQAPDSESTFNHIENAVSDGGISDAAVELTETEQVDNTLESEKADRAQLIENPDVEMGNDGQVELDDKANKDEVKKPEQALEAIENEKLREMMEKLLEAGEKQLNVISGLSERVKDLEKKLYSRNKVRTKKSRSRRSVSKNVK